MLSVALHRPLLTLVAGRVSLLPPPRRAADLGPVVAIGLSTTRYRSNNFSHHEVYVDEQQV